LARVQKLQRFGSENRTESIPLPGCRARRNRASEILAVSAVFAAALAFAAAAVADSAPSLDVEGMTFVASREDGDVVILHAEQARFDTNAKKAYLEVVDAEIPPNSNQMGFTMSCDSGVVDLASNDFEATGNVTGHADSGEDFATDWVRYDHAKGILFTDSPVLITDEGTTIQGGGFHYDVADRRFQMIGGARVVRTAIATPPVETAPAKAANRKNSETTREESKP
jgi:LPS export ABC transporter protein LptC